MRPLLTPEICQFHIWIFPVIQQPAQLCRVEANLRRKFLMAPPDYLYVLFQLLGK